MDPQRRPGITAQETARIANERREEAAGLRMRIYGELQRSFAHFIRQQFDRSPTQDPVLGALFLAVADQLAPVYEAAEEHLPQAILDELLRGLDAPSRTALPAQTVAQFIGQQSREVVRRTTRLVAWTDAGRHVRFAPDARITVSPTRLVFAAVYEPGEPGSDGRLHTVPGAELPSGAPVAGGQARVSLEGAPPTLFLAFRPEDEHHLSGLGLFVDTMTPASPVARLLQRSPWQLLTEVGGRAGVVTPKGVLHGPLGSAGPRHLEWVDRSGTDAPSRQETDEEDVFPPMAGHYGPQVWLWPEVPEERRFRSHTPPPLRDAVRELLPKGQEHALDEPCVWVRVPLGPEGKGASLGIRRIVPHCVTASNLEIWSSERVVFKQMGESLAFLPEGNADRHIVGVLDVTGESGAAYVDVAVLGDAGGAGSYRVRSPLLEFTPYQMADRADAFARVRLLVSDAEAGNGVQADRTFMVEGGFSSPAMQVVNLTESRGGKVPPSVEVARQDFAARLRTRDRIVTAADLEVAARAFDPRIRSVSAVGSFAERGIGGLRPVTRVEVRADAAQFDDPATDLPALGAQLEAHLQSRAALGITVRVRVAGHA